jgi:amino acid transporter
MHYALLIHIYVCFHVFLWAVTLVAVNCTYTKYVTRLQSLFTFGKAAAMLIIIIAALTTVTSGKGRHKASVVP